MTTKKNKPKFNVPNLGFFRSVKARWRKPRGTHNKKRMKMKWAGASPHIGYRNPVELRGTHPSGLREALVHNVAELGTLKDVVVRIASGVGARKKKLIEDKAKSLNLRVLNAEASVPSRHAPAEKKAEPAAAPKPAPQKPAAKPAAPAQQARPAQKPQAKKAAPKAPETRAGPEMKR